MHALSLSAAVLAEILYCTACANVDHPLITGHGPPQFRLTGQVYHQTGRLLSVTGQAPKFSQIYIHQCTSSLMSGCGMRREIVSFLQAGLLRVNPFVWQSRTAAESAQTGNNMELIIRPGTADISLWSYRDVTAAREVTLPHQRRTTSWSSQGWLPAVHRQKQCYTRAFSVSHSVLLRLACSKHRFRPPSQPLWLQSSSSSIRSLQLSRAAAAAAAAKFTVATAP